MKYPTSIWIMFWLLLSCGTVEQVSQPMNVILIVTDDQGYGDLSFHQNDLVETPNLDQLAAESAEFTRFYVSPVCAPTRASLLTGRYHLRTGTSWVTHRTEVMRSEEVTLAEVFQANGYRTGLFGKWHNGKQYPHDPLGQGFESFVGFTDGHLNNYFDPLLTRQSENTRMEGYVSEIFTNEAIRFIDSSPDPFFCYLSYNTPHSPFQVADPYFDKYKSKGLSDKDACIYGMVEDIDHQIGKLRAHLAANKDLFENTLIIFLTDNGPNGVRYTNGLKGRKGQVDEGGVRVPFILHHPGEPAWAGRKITNMAAHIDLLPTLADLLSWQLSDTLRLDGTSLLPLLAGKPIKERYFYTHQVRRAFDTIPGAVRSERYLLTLKEQQLALYDLLQDSTQQEDLSKSMPKLVEELWGKYQHWLADVTDEGIEPPAIEIGHAGIPLVEFPAPDADLEHLSFEGGSGWANDWLNGWQSDSKATWPIRAVADGHYRVFLEMGYAASLPLDLMVGCEDNSLSETIQRNYPATDIPSPDRVRRGEVYEKAWPLVEVGVLEVGHGEHTLALMASGEAVDQLEVKSVQLRPIEMK